MDTEHQIPIWFFIGALLTIYGVLIVGAGVYAWLNPASVRVFLAYLHADVWWGLLLVVIGLFYTLRFAPWRKPA
jgi:hypothetical protein